jgi:hypothetical protein
MAAPGRPGRSVYEQLSLIGEPHGCVSFLYLAYHKKQKGLPLGEAAHAPALESALTPIPSQAETSPCAEELAASKDIASTASAGEGLDSHHFLQDHLDFADTIPQDG